jgi:hypothetical protein
MSASPKPSSTGSDEAFPFPSFTRGMFAGVLQARLIFPYGPLSNLPSMAAVLRESIKGCVRSRIRRSARIDPAASTRK